jgi:hypothetical protein
MLQISYIDEEIYPGRNPKQSLPGSWNIRPVPRLEQDRKQFGVNACLKRNSELSYRKKTNRPASSPACNIRCLPS